MDTKRGRKEHDVMTTLRGQPLIDEARGVVDELQGWYTAKADADGLVYTSALRQLLNKLYRDRDYLAKRKADGHRTAYDWAVERDQKALAWAVRALVCFTPSEEKRKPEPPKKPRKPARRLSPAEKARYRGRPSWNGQPKRDWEGAELPPPGSGSGSGDLPPTPPA